MHARSHRRCTTVKAYLITGRSLYFSPTICKKRAAEGERRGLAGEGVPCPSGRGRGGWAAGQRAGRRGRHLARDRVEVALPLRRDPPPLAVGHLLDDLERLELLEDVAGDRARPRRELLADRAAHLPPPKDLLEGADADAAAEVDAAGDRGCGRGKGGERVSRRRAARGAAQRRRRAAAAAHRRGCSTSPGRTARAPCRTPS